MTTTNQSGTVTQFLNARLLRVAALDNDPYTTETLRDYCDVVDDAIDRKGYGHSLFRQSPDLLRTSKAVVFSIKENNHISAALHMAPDPSGDFTWINGVVKGENQSGAVMRELMAISMVTYALDMPTANVFRACYRQFPNGFRDQFGKTRAVNKGSAKLFLDFNFESVGTEEVSVEGDYQDTHLFDFCEPDSTSFRVNVVQSQDDTLNVAREYLKVISSSLGRGDRYV